MLHRPLLTSSGRDSSRLGHLTLQVAIHLLRFASVVKCIPFFITSRTKFRAKMMKRFWERCLWHVVNAAIYLHAVFQVSTVTHSILFSGLTSANALQLVCCTLCLLTLVFYQNVRTYSSGVVASIYQLECLKELNEGRHLGSCRYAHCSTLTLYKTLFTELGFHCRACYCDPFVVLTLNYFAVLGFCGSIGIPAICVFYPNNPLFLYYLIP